MRNGVTLLVLVVAISVMFVIISSASVIGINSINQANYEEYKSMIKRVSDDINSYYLTNKELPINNEIISVDSLGMDFSNNVKNNKDENDTFYIVNIDKLNNQTITNGRGTLQNKDVFLIAKNSNNLYYLKGFNFNGKTNYSLRNEENTTVVTADNIERYVKTGLILHYDGINNTGTSHSSSTTVWKDLSGNNNNGTLVGYNFTDEYKWDSNKLITGNFRYVQLPIQLFINSDFTIQTVIGLYGNYGYGIGQEGTTVTRRTSIAFYDSKARYAFEITPWSIYGDSSYTSGQKVLITVKRQSGKYYIKNNNGIWNTVSTFDNYIPVSANSRIGCMSLTSDYPKSSTLSVRAYFRALSDTEVTQNYQVDVERFGI